MEPRVFILSACDFVEFGRVLILGSSFWDVIKGIGDTLLGYGRFLTKDYCGIVVVGVPSTSRVRLVYLWLDGT